MKTVKKILTHPLLIILIFCGIIISGEQMGGFYLLYILLGLPHFVVHSVLGIVGIICLLLTYYAKQTRGLLSVIGAVCMIASLLYFFLQPNGRYNYNTFSEPLPLLTLIVFGALIVFFLVSNSTRLIHKVNKTNGHFIA